MNETLKYKFDDLSLEDKLAHFEKVAQKAKKMWDYPEDAKLKLLNFSENATFLVSWGQAGKSIMRVHRTYYAEMDSIRTELRWLLDLSKETDLKLTTPIQAKSGNYVETVSMPEMDEERHVVCFEFAEGKAPTDSSDENENLAGLLNSMEKVPDAITKPLFSMAAVVSAVTGKWQKKSPMTEVDRKMYRKLGYIAATLHVQSSHWNVPNYYSRIEWDWDGTFGNGWNNFYGADYRDTTCIPRRDIKTLETCVALMKRRIEAYGKEMDRYGMIHSDLRMANLLKQDEDITVLDFDDCGRGWYMYDIAGIVALMEHRSDIREVVKEIVAGYESVRALSAEDKREIPTFIMMRRIGMLQSLNYRLGNVACGEGDAIKLTPEVLVFYAKGTVMLAKDYIKAYEAMTVTETYEDKTAIVS